MKKITYLAAAIAFLGFASLDANAQNDKNKKKSKKKEKVEQTTEVETEVQAETETQVNYEEQVQTETQTQTQTQTEAQGQNEKREAITQEELPEPVKQTLSAATFSSWQIVEVFRVTPNENARGANAQGTENRAEQANQNAQSQNAQANAQGHGAKTMYEIFFTNEQEQDAKVRIDEQGNIIRDQK
jgi:outer membrane biosynthesis protein TonB